MCCRAFTGSKKEKWPFGKGDSALYAGPARQRAPGRGTPSSPAPPQCRLLCWSTSTSKTRCSSAAVCALCTSQAGGDLQGDAVRVSLRGQDKQLCPPWREAFNSHCLAGAHTQVNTYPPTPGDTQGRLPVLFGVENPKPWDATLPPPELKVPAGLCSPNDELAKPPNALAPLLPNRFEVSGERRDMRA